MQILATKLHLPSPRASTITRPRLLDLLNEGIQEQRKLTLVSAPAGYGKTLLISEWLHSLARSADGIGQNVKAAWLSLDEADNDLARFARYWLAAFQQAVPTMFRETQALFDSPQLPPFQTLLDQLLNDLAALEAPIILALDDYHIIHNPQIHEALEYFLVHQPEQVHLVIITRADPPLPVARLRTRGQLTEIRAQTLRFTTQEAQQFFSRLLNLPLDAHTLRALDERTEGWAAGLHLAALALQHQADPAAFVETFHGSHRYILDYLAEEVLHQQGEHIRAFLTKTSILDRFNAEACSDLTGRDDSQALIQYLEQSNLFIMPLDNERRWYRYHHLFSDYLRSLLSKAEETALYQKTSAWHEAASLTEEAVRYALASDDLEFAAGVIERALKKNHTWSGGNLSLLLSWLEALPQQVFSSRPGLGLHASRILFLAGRFNQAEMRIAQAEQALMSQPETPETGEMRALAALYRGSIASVRGDFQQAIEQTTYAQARLPLENHLAHARGFFSLGLAYELADQTGLAVENFLRSSTEARTAGVLFLAVHAACAAAQAQIKLGRFHLAEQTCQVAIEWTGGARIAPVGLAWIILGGIALERNDLPAAEKWLEDGTELARKGGLLDDVILGLVFLTRLRVYLNDITAALEAMEEAKAILRSFGIARMETLAAAFSARLQLYLGQKADAAQWAEKYRASGAAPAGDFEELTLARTLLVNGELDPIPGILHPVLEKANAAGRMQTSIETMLLLGLFHYARREMAPALEWLEKSLRLAAPEGYSRVFLDQGEAAREILPKARHAAPGFVDSILGSSKPAAASPTPALKALPEPLSEQELRVLKLIVAGKSNQEIADVLVISVGTAKWHVHNVLQKLGVNSRPKAIALARELGIES